MDLPLKYQNGIYSDPVPKKNRTGKPRSDWEELLEKYKAKINPERVKAGYPELSDARLGKLLNNAGVHNAAEAYRFYRKLETEAKNFGALFSKLTDPKRSRCEAEA